MAMPHTARKRFGQHFLVDHSVIDRIVKAVDPHRGQALVEIGPGLGALTTPLLALCRSMTVIELDRDLAAQLERRPGLNVLQADVLTVDFGALAEVAGQSLRVVGNLPYNISTPILFALMPWAHRIVDQHFMLQKEVVARMVARPQTAEYGRLTVMLQWRYELEAVLDVPAGAFDPPPRVESTVVRMQPKPHPAPVDARLLSEVVQTAFSQRRKLLRHTLGRWMETRGLEVGFDLQRRAEEVPVQAYVELALAADAAAGRAGSASAS